MIAVAMSIGRSSSVSSSVSSISSGSTSSRSASSSTVSISSISISSSSRITTNVFNILWWKAVSVAITLSRAVSVVIDDNAAAVIVDIVIHAVAIDDVGAVASVTSLVKLHMSEFERSCDLYCIE